MSDEERLVPDTYDSLFSFTPLTAEAELKGQLLTPENILVIRNERAKIAEQKVRRDFDPKNVENYIQTEAQLKGQLQMLDWLLDIDKAAREIIRDKLSQQQQSN
jgi:hypothetical protein